MSKYGVCSGPNTGIYAPPYFDTFHAVDLHAFRYFPYLEDSLNNQQPSKCASVGTFCFFSSIYLNFACDDSRIKGARSVSLYKCEKIGGVTIDMYFDEFFVLFLANFFYFKQIILDLFWLFKIWWQAIQLFALIKWICSYYD